MAVQQHLPQEQLLRIRRLEALHAMLALDSVSEVSLKFRLPMMPWSSGSDMTSCDRALFLQMASA